MFGPELGVLEPAARSDPTIVAPTFNGKPPDGRLEASPMRVLLADGHSEVRWALRMVLGEEADFTVVGEASERIDLLSQAQVLHPELIVLEWELLGQRADKLLAALCALDGPVRVIVLSRQPDCEEAALAAGADAFVSKADGPEQLLAALHRLVES